MKYLGRNDVTTAFVGLGEQNISGQKW